MAEALLSASAIARLREALTVARYTTAGLLAARSVGGAEPGTPLDTLLRFFEYGRAVPADQLQAALAPLTLDEAYAGGIIESGQDGDRDGDGARAGIYIQPYQDWWVVTDVPKKIRSGPLPTDYVVEVADVPTLLAGSVVRASVNSALDLCCGGGVQSLHLSGHAKSVTATDLSNRALTFAATTAALNGFEWDLRCGDFAEPVAGQRFDLVVCNPPFIIGPGAVGYYFRDSGLPGDQLGAHLAAQAPGLLTEGGYMQYFAGWAHIAGEDWSERVAGWAAGTGLDAWIIQLDRLDPADYIQHWTFDPDSAGGRSWFDWLREQRVEALSMGLVTLRNAGNDDPVIRVEDDLEYGQVSGADVAAWFGRSDWIRNHDLLTERFRAVDGLRLESAASLREGEWVRERYLLTTPAGPMRTDQVSDLIVSIVAGCDGSVRLDEQLTGLAAELGADVRELVDAALPAVTQLVEHHMIEPVLLAPRNARLSFLVRSAGMRRDCDAYCSFV